MISFLISFAPISHLLKKEILENFIFWALFGSNKVKHGTKNCPYQCEPITD